MTRPSSRHIRLAIGVAVSLAMATVGALQPAAGSATASGGVGSTSVFETTRGVARLPIDLGWYSYNWAGYALAGGPYASVSGQWTVPQVRGGRSPRFSAMWVGIDGSTNDSLIQAGTEADFYGGRAHYSAWWEILPAPAVRIRSLSVRPGDRMTAAIVRVGPGRWRITIRDARSGSYTTTRLYDGPASSAEWIEEAPVVSGRFTQLAAHGTVGFDNVRVNGASAPLSTADGGAMVRRGVFVETPSAPDADGNGFALAEQQIPPSQPIS